jgi:hypothetical protein
MYPDIVTPGTYLLIFLLCFCRNKRGQQDAVLQGRESGVLHVRVRTLWNHNNSLFRMQQSHLHELWQESHKHRNGRLTAGAIVVLHPFSRSLGFNPHIHILMTEGDMAGLSIKSSSLSTLCEKF